MPRRNLRSLLGQPRDRTLDLDTFDGATASISPTGFVRAITITIDDTVSNFAHPLAWLASQRPVDARLIESSWPQPGTLRRTFVSRDLSERAAEIGLGNNIDPSRQVETIEYDPRSGDIESISVSFGTREPR